MFDYISGIAIVLVYILIGYYIMRFIRSQTTQMKLYPRLLLLSFFCTLIFGIGIVGSGGDPGFAFPCPIIVTGIIYILNWVETKIFINGFIIPLAFWWTIIFIVMLTKNKIKAKMQRKVETEFE